MPSVAAVTETPARAPGTQDTAPLPPDVSHFAAKEQQFNPFDHGTMMARLPLRCAGAGNAKCA
jgi:hypothetical protein